MCSAKLPSINFWYAFITFAHAKVKDYKKYYIIPAAPELVYKALTLPATIQLWSGEAAEMSTVPGSEFSLWEGSIVGKNLEFEENKKIVQQWYFGEQTEPSIVTIILHDHQSGTSVELRHTNIPDEDFSDIKEGWDNNYFGSLQDFYED
jgi:activator of HSP90 ATPase